MKTYSISLNELTKWSWWPRALLSGDSKFDSGYREGRYERLLESLPTGWSFDEVKAVELARTVSAEYGNPDKPNQMCFSKHNDLFVGSLHDVLDMMVGGIANEIEMSEGWFKSRAVVELGCGYGYNLYKISEYHLRHGGRSWIGGEINPAAVEIGRRLFGEVRIKQTDMTSGTLDLLGLASPPIVVFTNHAVEQIESYESILNGLRGYKGDIFGVVHREPILDPKDTSLLGELRRSYRKARGYNNDMMDVLNSASDVVIDRVQYDDIGANPLNPTGTVAWRFA